MLNDSKIAAYTAILQEELLLATGCTEPIAVAYCAAKLREVLGGKPEKILAEISGNILKNVKSVVVPNTGGRRGIDAAIAVGIVAGDADAELQVIANVTEADVAAIQTYLDSTDIRVTCPETPCLLDIKLTGWREGHHACVRVANNHTNIIYMEKDGNILRELPVTGNAEDNLQDKSVLNVQDIITFAETVPLDNIRPTVGRQIEKNTAIAAEGLRNSWGANIGSTLLESSQDWATQARAWAAAGSDARMNGCEMPVVIVSGSGNQGITASVPVWKYGKLMGADDDTILRAVCLSDLITIHQKTGVGRRLLRRGQRRGGRGLRHRVAAGRGLRGHQPHAGKRRGHDLRLHLRRCQGQLRQQDRHGRGLRHLGLRHVRRRQQLPPRRRHSGQRRGGHHPERRRAGRAGHAGDRPGDFKDHDRVKSQALPPASARGSA